MTTRDPPCCRRVFVFRKHVLPGGALGSLLGTFASISGVLAIAAVRNLAGSASEAGRPDTTRWQAKPPKLCKAHRTRRGRGGPWTLASVAWTK